MDDLIHQGIKQKENILGGAGLYALAGAALFSKVPILVTGVGKDFSEKFGPWFDKNNLSKNEKYCVRRGKVPSGKPPAKHIFSTEIRANP